MQTTGQRQIREIVPAALYAAPWRAISLRIQERRSRNRLANWSPHISGWASITGPLQVPSPCRPGPPLPQSPDQGGRRFNGSAAAPRNQGLDHGVFPLAKASTTPSTTIPTRPAMTRRPRASPGTAPSPCSRSGSGRGRSGTPGRRPPTIDRPRGRRGGRAAPSAAPNFL